MCLGSSRVAAVVISGLIAVTLLGCAERGGADEPSAFASTDPTESTSAPTSTPTSPEPAPSAPPTRSVRQGDQLFRVSYSALRGEGSVQRTAGGYVVASVPVVGLDRRGRETWQLQVPRRAEAEVTVDVALGVVVVTYPIPGQDWPGFTRVVALDPASGDELWRDDRASFVSVWDDTVYTTVCLGRQEATLGDCTISARSPRDGGTRWSLPSYHAAQVSDAGNDWVLVVSYPGSGSPAVVRAVDVMGGSSLGPHIPIGHSVAAVDGAVLTTGPKDTGSADACRQRVTATGFDGVVLWQQTYRPGEDPLDPGECRSVYVDGGQAGLASVWSYEGVARLVDATDGRTIWTGRRGAELALMTSGLVVAVDTRGGFATGASGVDPATGERLWRAPAEAGNTWELRGGVVLSTDTNCFDDCHTEARRPRTGRVVEHYPGLLRAAGPDWLSTVADINAELGDYRVFRR